MRRLLLFSVAAVLAFMVTPAAAEPDTGNFYIWLENNQLVGGTGDGYYDNSGAPDADDNPTPWYYYPNTNWYNQWYYDGEYDATRSKLITYEIQIQICDSWGPFTIALNWSTPEYSEVPWTFEVVETPPLPLIPNMLDFSYPGPLTPVDEQAWIQRAVIYDYDGVNPPAPPESISGTFMIQDYNPEWVSIDIRAGWTESRVILEGTITHECIEKIIPIPAPGAILLSSIGVGLVGWLRRRRAL